MKINSARPAHTGRRPAVIRIAVLLHFAGVVVAEVLFVDFIFDVLLACFFDFVGV
jgi:hypothetical protein